MAVKKTGRATAPEKNTPIEVEVDITKFILGDYLLFGRMSGKTTTPAEVVAFLDRVVVGGVVNFPITSYVDVLNAVTKKLDELTNPK